MAEAGKWVTLLSEATTVSANFTVKREGDLSRACKDLVNNIPDKDLKQYCRRSVGHGTKPAICSVTRSSQHRNR